MEKRIYIFALILSFLALAPVHVVLAAEPNTEPTVLEDVIVTADREDGVGGNDTIQQIVTNYIVKASNYAVYFLVALTVLVFMYGLMVYMFKGRESDAARTEGRKLMLWGIIGIFVMISVWGIVKMVSSTFGHTSTALPQFKTEQQVAPHGRWSDGTPITDGQNDAFQKGKRTVKEKLQQLWRGGRNLVENGRQNASSMINSFRGFFNRQNNSQ